MATAANFAATPNTTAVLISTANTAVDGTGTAPVAWTAGASGGRLDSVKITGQVAEGATQAADCVRLFWNDGTNKHLFLTQLIAAGSGPVSATVANVEFVIPLGVVVPTGWTLLASTHTGGATATYQVMAIGGNF